MVLGGAGRARGITAGAWKAALRLLAEPELDALVKEEIAFEDAPRRLTPGLRGGHAWSAPVYPLPEFLTHRRFAMYAVEVRDRS